MIILLFPIVVMADENRYGLWVGQIELDQVTEITSGTIQPVKHVFDMKLLLHVDKDNVVRLLRHVTIMQKTEIIDEEETVRRALITDDSLIPDYEGIVRRDGKLAGIRLGSLAFGFSSESDTSQTTMEGAIAEGQQISCTLTMNEDHPTNPFKHLYHPDHKKGKKISRNIKLTFNNKPDNNNTDPDDEKYALDGIYEEKITGLHKQPISIAGSFNIQHVSVVDILNDGKNQ